ncbi:MAG: hypothetical protein H0U98_09065 [Alphaproteobacteria bacterium]|nr:hypothetical protein [Alphaproteobacteria bacterium]
MGNKMRAAATGLICLAAVSGAAAQGAKPKVESVTVTGERERAEQIKRFVESFAAPTYLLGKLARWETGICPIAAGLRPAAIEFIVQRLRDNAKLAGAPVNDKPDCRANIEIVFTTTPQDLLDHVRNDHAVYLGYSRNGADADRMARVLHPIQAWYTTASKDIVGITKIDKSRTVGLELEDLQIAMAMGSVTGLRTRDGRRSTLYHVIIAIDPAKLAEHEIGGIADYISFLALSPVASLDRCQQLASVMNMLVPGCAAAANQMTPNDLAFLRGLYRMTLDGNLGLQKDGISHEMKEEAER